jgi:hypothetical protein
VAVQFVSGRIFVERSINLRDKTPINSNVTASILPFVIVLTLFFILYYATGTLGIRRASYKYMAAFFLLTLGEMAAGIYFWVFVINDSLFGFTRIFFSMYVSRLLHNSFSCINLLILLSTLIVAVILTLDFTRGSDERDLLLQVQSIVRRTSLSRSLGRESEYVIDPHPNTPESTGTNGSLSMIPMSKPSRFEIVLD